MSQETAVFYHYLNCMADRSEEKKFCYFNIPVLVPEKYVFIQYIIMALTAQIRDAISVPISEATKNYSTSISVVKITTRSKFPDHVHK